MNDCDEKERTKKVIKSGCGTDYFFGSIKGEFGWQGTRERSEKNRVKVK